MVLPLHKLQWDAKKIMKLLWNGFLEACDLNNCVLVIINWGMTASPFQFAPSSATPRQHGGIWIQQHCSICQLFHFSSFHFLPTIQTESLLNSNQICHSTTNCSEIQGKCIDCQLWSLSSPLEVFKFNKIINVWYFHRLSIQSLKLKFFLQRTLKA